MLKNNYYEQLSDQLFPTGINPKTLVEFHTAEQNGTIPKVAGHILCCIGKVGITEKPKTKSEMILQKSRYSYIHLPGGRNLKSQWTIEEIKEHMESGHSIHNGIYRDPDTVLGEKKWTFIGAQFIKANMLIVDIDDGNPSLENLIEWSKPYRPTMIYETLSSTPAIRKYRIMYLLDKTVEATEYKMMTQYLINKIPGADQACKDLGRLFLGGKKVPFFEGNFIKVEDMLNLPEVSALREIIENRKVKKVKTGVVVSEQMTITEKEIAEKLQGISKRYTIEKIDKMKAFEFINALSISEIIGVNVGDTFRCVMPDHMDRNPSTTIMEINGTERYKCHACVESRPKSFLDTIMGMTGKSVNETVEFILGNLNIKFDTDYRWNSLKKIQMNRIFISQNQETKIYKKLKNARLLGTYISFTNYVENYLPESPIEGVDKLSMFASIRHISKTFREWGLAGSSVSRISEKMRDLASYGLIEKVDYEDLPENMRRASELKKAEMGVRYAITYWRVPELTPDILERAVEKMEEERGVGYTKKHLNRVQMFKMHGAEETLAVYNQDIAIASETVTAELYRTMSHLIKVQGYFTKQELIDNSPMRETIIHQYLPGVAKDMDLRYITFNKKIGAELNISLPRNSKIYICE